MNPTFQRLFTNALLGVRAQGGPGGDTVKVGRGPSASTYHSNAYLAANGCRCNVGHNIPPKAYRRVWDEKGVAIAATFVNRSLSHALRESISLPTDPPELLHSEEGMRFLRELQNAHDYPANDATDGGKPFLPLYEAAMAKLASDYQLSYNQPEA